MGERKVRRNFGIIWPSASCWFWLEGFSLGELLLQSFCCCITLIPNDVFLQFDASAYGTWRTPSTSISHFFRKPKRETERAERFVSSSISSYHSKPLIATDHLLTSLVLNLLRLGRHWVLVVSYLRQFALYVIHLMMMMSYLGPTTLQCGS